MGAIRAQSSNLTNLATATRRAYSLGFRSSAAELMQ